MADQKKFLDYEGVKHLWSKINMQDYPNNETLMAVINAIDETKVDKIDDKGLSTNDFTNEYKEKLDGLENYATESYVNEGLATKQPIGDYALKTDILSPDLSQNDPEAVDYVKGRTHWIEEKTLFQEISATFSSDGEGIPGLFPGINIAFGENVTVVWDGVSYEQTAMYDYGIYYIGNISLLGIPNTVDTGEPFLIAYVGQNNLLQASKAGSHTVSIRGTEYNTLNAAFLPVASNSTPGAVRFGKGYDCAARVIETYFGATKEEIENAYEAYENEGIVWRMAGDTVLSVTNVNNGIYLTLGRDEPSDVRITFSADGTETNIERVYSNYVHCRTRATVGQTIVVKSVDEDGKPTEWEAIDMPEQVQSDWDQSDETAPDHIKNKPLEETEDDAMKMLVEMGIIDPVTDEEGNVFTDESGNILTI